MGDVFPFSLGELQGYFSTAIYKDSFVIHEGAALWLGSSGPVKQLAILTRAENPLLEHFEGGAQEFRAGYILKRCPVSHANAYALRSALTWLQPRLIGLETSAGFGDRLGLATPGHVQALRHAQREARLHMITPIFAQQSIREMQRTGRSPVDVLNDATWGAFQAGWRGTVGADADHLKSFADIDACVAAGYTFYTIDPGAYVDSKSASDDPATVRQKVESLPWQELESSPAELQRRYTRRQPNLHTPSMPLSEQDIWLAAAKYGKAVAHIVSMYRYLAAKDVPFELEISVDETETPTSHAEHIYIASELRRLGVQWVSLAPRYVGRFEKGVEYIGNLHELQANLNGHAAIARALGPYKLSLHSGSDKFKVYPLIVAATGGLVHLKTAGTSYVEALRVIARVRPALFREIVACACEHYAHDRASYHVSAEVSHVPTLSSLPDTSLVGLLDDNNARQILHVTFGSVLSSFGPAIIARLQAHEDMYYETLEQHFYRHLKPFGG
ncbi:MAG: tagaturonate epimerase family protein [Chloroflexota bacterium]|nr:tagaturonate epimerase family protein [Chloroflexota bacterium]